MASAASSEITRTKVRTDNLAAGKERSRAASILSAGIRTRIEESLNVLTWSDDAKLPGRAWGLCRRRSVAHILENGVNVARSADRNWTKVSREARHGDLPIEQ